MRRSLDIALYFLNRVDREAGDTISALKLQKLVYYAQAWIMVLRNQLLCRSDEFHASLNPDLEGLKNTFLDAIERSHPNYAKAVSEALTEALDIPDNTPAMTTAHEFGAWLTSL